MAQRGTTRSASLAASIAGVDATDRIVEGLRIPSSLDAQIAVNFVLTQEAGKLKPKDLKIAIEKNRAEREARAEEQKKLRELGGGAGVLDLRGILAEERLNFTPGDAFRRQLREISFLQDIEEVDKQETEKEFRISEDYYGGDQLSNQDIEAIWRQRRLSEQVALRTQWRGTLGRQRSSLLPPHHPTIKAGTTHDRALDLVSMNRPSFDPNRNDIWAKRLTTLRRFIALVSKWLVRRRVQRRMGQVLATFHEHGAFTRAEVRAFVEKENETPATSVARRDTSTPSSSKPIPPTDLTSNNKNISFAEMVLGWPSDALLIRQRNEKIFADFSGEELSATMARRRLFPVSSREALQPATSSSAGATVSTSQILNEIVAFDDRSYFRLKTRPAYITRRYTEMPYPTMQQLLPVAEDKETRLLAPEEQFLRGPVDASGTERHYSHVANAPIELETLRKESQELVPNLVLFPQLDDPFRPVGSLDMDALLDEALQAAPRWLVGGEVVMTLDECSVTATRPSYRSFSTLLPIAENDAMYPLRPCLEQQALFPRSSTSLRAAWSDAIGGFDAANRYLLGAADSFAPTSALPETPGPTLSDVYLPDHDRHLSGLNCFSVDHNRPILAWDADVRGLQQVLDKEDQLTDSESDDDDAYRSEKVTMKSVKALLSAAIVKEEIPDPKKKPDPKKAAAGAKDAKPAVAAPAADVEMDDEALLGEGERREEQVELLRDRKTLELASALTKAKKQGFERTYNQYAEIAKRQHPLYAMDVSVPFHLYEDEVYRHMGQFVPEKSQVLVELDGNMMLPPPPTSMSVTSLPPYSPGR